MKSNLLKRLGFALIVSVFCVCCSGCLLNHSHHVVLRQDEPLYAAYFESDEARSMYESYVSQQIEDRSTQSESSFAIPFIIGAERSVRLAENAIRNDCAIRFDKNSDGLISDSEAAAMRK